jgi:hypothetical protein
MPIIEDGTGTGKQARVDSNNRLDTHATTIPESRDENLFGNAYNINPGLVTLTNANESAILHFKNQQLTDYVITAVVAGLGPSTGGASTSIPVIKVYRNPTGGTITVTPTDVDINSNRNYGSSNTLNALAYKGAQGATTTGGTEHLLFYQATNGRLFASIEEILPQGATLAVTVTPQTDNTSMTCYVALVGYLRARND